MTHDMMSSSIPVELQEEPDSWVLPNVGYFWIRKNHRREEPYDEEMELIIGPILSHEYFRITQNTKSRDNVN